MTARPISCTQTMSQLALTISPTKVSGLGFVFTLRSRARMLRFVVKQLFKIALNHARNIAIFQNPDDVAYFAAMATYQIGMLVSRA